MPDRMSPRTESLRPMAIPVQAFSSILYPSHTDFRKQRYKDVPVAEPRMQSDVSLVCERHASWQKTYV